MIQASGPGSLLDPGPALAAQWEVWTTPAGSALRVLRGATSAATGPTGWCLPLAVGVDGAPAAPVFGLTLVLSRQPLASDASIRDLVRLGSLGLGLTLASPPELMAELGSAHGARLRPLFPRSVEMDLLGPDASAPSWCSVAAAGPDATGALSATLDRDGALAVLDALEGTASGALVRIAASADLDPVTRTVRVHGRWIDLYDGWAAATSDGTLTRGQVLDVAARLLGEGVLSAEAEDVTTTGLAVSDATSEIAGTLLRYSSFLLRRLEVADGAEPRFALGDRPSPYVPLGLTVRTSVPQRVDVSFDTPLEELLGHLLDGLDVSAFVRLVVPEPGPAGFSAARTRRTGTVPRERAALRPEQLMIARGDVLRSLPLALTPDLAVQPPASALIAGDLTARPRDLAPGRRAYLLDDTVALLPMTPVLSDDDRPLDLPLVADPAAALWPDRNDVTRHWYAESLDPVAAAASDDPATSGFLFRVTPTGLSQDLHQGLEATLRIRLARSVPPGAAVDALPGGDVIAPVPLGGLSATLDVPYRDSASGSTRTQPFVGTVVEEADGTLTVSVSLLDDWVRLCYGALSYPGFQTLPVRLRVCFAYRAYVPSGQGELQVAAGGKILALQATLARDVEAAGEVLQLKQGELRLTVEQPEPPEAVARLRPVSDGGETPTTIEDRPHRIHEPVVVLSPPISVPLPPRPAPVLRSLVHEQVHELLYPCADLGALYRQAGADSDVALGCQDVLRLGETTSRQYAELPDLADPSGRYRLFSSLQQPGLFLVVPAAYRITRYGPDEPAERNFRPAAILYGEIGATAAETRYQLRATLQPDLGVDVRRAIEAAARARTPFGHEPVLVFPTDPSLQAVPDYAWAALPDGDLPVVLRSWDDLQVTVSVPVLDALLLTRLLEGAGFSGTVTFRLPDGQQIQSALVLDSMVVGPWRCGPVPVTLAPGTATLTNRIERAVTVLELLTEGAAGATTATPVNAQLAPGASVEVAVPADAVDAWVRSVPVGGPVDLATLDVFVEDLTTQLGIFGQLNFANHALTGAVVEVRISGTSGPVWSTPVTEAQTSYLTLTLPITTYLLADALEYRISATHTEGPSTLTSWLPWDLQHQGVLISITSESISSAAPN